MPRLKIAHVTPSFYPASVYGGPTVSVFGLCRALARLGHDVRVLTTNANGRQAVLGVNPTQELNVEGLRVRYCPRLLPEAFSPVLVGALPRYIRWADVVHLTAVYSTPTIPTLFWAARFGKPVVWSPRGALQRWRGTRRRVLKAVWEGMCRLTAGNNVTLHVTSDQEEQESRVRLPRLGIRVIPNGVDVPGTAVARPRGDARRLLYVGRLDPIKGLENLLAAVELLAADGQSWSLTVAGAGDPAYTTTLLNEVERRALSNRVRWVGEVRDGAMRELFAESDILVLPSFSENFGMVVAEALAAGLPVVASKGTPWQRVETIGCGRWVDNDPPSLARAIAELATQPLAEMGARGRAWMSREFGWEARAKEMLELYQDVIGRPPPAAHNGASGPEAHALEGVELSVRALHGLEH